MAVIETYAPQSASSQFNKSWTIRLADNGDEADIHAVAVSTWQATYGATVRPTNQERVIRQSYSAAALRRAFARNGKNIWFWVVQDNATCHIIGFMEVVLWAGPNSAAELTRIYILPAFQRRGIGAACLDQIRATLSSLEGDLKPPRLVLSVEAHNQSAINFYESRGFRLTREFIIPLVGQLLEMKEYVLNLE